MFPELFRIPFLGMPLATYGLMLALAFVVGLYTASRQAGGDERIRTRVYDLGLYVLIAGLLGSKLLMVAAEWSSFKADPSLIWSLDFFRSGGVFYGGFLGGLAAAVFFIRRWGLPWWPTLDAFAPGVAVGHMFGRIGCLSAGCCWGEPTTGWWGLHFTERGHELTGVPTTVAELTDTAQRAEWLARLGSLSAPLRLIPTQLIEAGVLLVIFLLLLWVSKRRQFTGQVILGYGLLYAVARFTIEFWRADPRGSVWFLSTSQFIALILGLVSLGLLVYRWRQVHPPSPVGKTVPAA